MLHTGLLSRPAIRQVQSDIVDVVALGRLQSCVSTTMSYPQNLDDATTEENKRDIRLLNHEEEKKEHQVEEAYIDRLIGDEWVKDGKRRQS